MIPWDPFFLYHVRRPNLADPVEDDDSRLDRQAEQLAEVASHSCLSLPLGVDRALVSPNHLSPSSPREEEEDGALFQQAMAEEGVDHRAVAVGGVAEVGESVSSREEVPPGYHLPSNERISLRERKWPRGREELVSPRGPPAWVGQGRTWSRVVEEREWIPF